MSETNFKVLIVDDEPDILEFLKYNLIKEGYQIFAAGNGLEAVEIAKREHPHLIILDVMMPEMDGIETCEELRKTPELDDTIVVFFTARGEDYSQVAGYEAGADDYITKPIKPKVLKSKVSALLKRHHHSEAAGTTATKLEIGDLIIDRERYLVIHEGEELILPKKEFELLMLLASKPEKVFTREEIYRTVWGNKIVVGDRTIDVHIRKLREKIGDDYIKTIKGVGYRFVEQ
ncbi:response regulator transcription factor [Saccharicrinis sp. FJH54]|uniref:response regulator transcription factor n=1 Tax=Saccharicrinis sp. FJH54 TaxID=3344665 RepID=UPI0035D4C62B